ncbi:HAUS augmin-like complex subunit 3 [Pleurodeles waltl]
MLTRRKSRSSILDGVRSRGSAFVEAVQRIGYPKAADLQGNSFDWLYEDPESARFLSWFCGLDESNILSDTAKKEFQRLQAAEETIMVEEELEQALLAHQISMTSSTMQGWSLEKEVNHLRLLNKRQNASLAKVRSCCFIQTHQSNSLNDGAKNAERDLIKLYPKLGDENIKQNDILSQTRKTIPKLIPRHSEYCRPPTTPLLLFSESNLSQYNRLEDNCMKALTEYITLIMETNFDVTPVKEVTKEVLECSIENTKEDLEQDLLQLEKSHVCRLKKQLSIEATEERTSAALKYAEELMGSYGSQLPERKVFGLGEQIHTLEEDVAQLSMKLLSLINENASYFRLPVLCADLDAEMVRLQYLSSKQEEVVSQILKQGSRQDMLTLALDVELHNHGQTARLVDEIQRDLRAKICGLEERLTHMGSPSVFSLIPRHPRIERRDQTVMRLWELLEALSNNKPSLSKYASMKHWTVALNQKLSALLSTPVIPQVQWTSLESELKKFHSQMYCSSKRLPLNPPKLSESIDKLLDVIAQVDHINNDCEEDFRKKISLSSQCCDSRNLYVYFFMDPIRLKEVLEEREYFAHSFSGVPSEKE